MTSPRKALIRSYVLFWIVAFAAAWMVGIVAANAKPALEAVQETQNVQQSENPIVPQTAQEAVENKPSEPSAAVDPVSVPTASTDTTAQPPYNMERIPFTQQEVTPGDPESYVGTYGQCPFYENAGEKGCIPPSDIECNADWTVCNPRQP